MVVFASFQVLKRGLREGILQDPAVSSEFPGGER